MLHCVFGETECQMLQKLRQDRQMGQDKGEILERGFGGRGEGSKQALCDTIKIEPKYYFNQSCRNRSSFGVACLYFQIWPDANLIHHSWIRWQCLDIHHSCIRCQCLNIQFTLCISKILLQNVSATCASTHPPPTHAHNFPWKS